MAQSTFSLAWDAYKNSLCNGLSNLQQNEEFVDMTLAADGHFVKVHQVILALASPYIKELISSIQCTHPVLFLNKISYTTLSQVLEYIYTGEVMVDVDNLSDFLEASNQLHIKGLENMKLNETLEAHSKISENDPEAMVEEVIEDDVSYLEVRSNDDSHSVTDDISNSVKSKPYQGEIYIQEQTPDDTSEEIKEHRDDDSRVRKRCADGSSAANANIDRHTPAMQYTVSNQGSLQMILNRFLYYLKHTNQNSSRQWRCVDYVSNLKCPAYVVTKNEMVLHRISAHTHVYHDAKILKKVRRGAIFAAVQDAERVGTILTNNRAQQQEEQKNRNQNEQKGKKKKQNTEEKKSLEFCSVSESES